jgi:hypothetical protein
VNVPNLRGMVPDSTVIVAGTLGGGPDTSQALNESDATINAKAAAQMPL